MCVILVCPETVRPKPEVLYACHEANPHGAGVAWREAGRVRWQKNLTAGEVMTLLKKLEGEVVVSRDTAHRMAAEYQWEPQSELLLYIIHGTLHLTGMDDATDQLRDEIQKAETRYLASIGLQRPAEQQSPGGHP